MTIHSHRMLPLTDAAGGRDKALRDRWKANCTVPCLSDRDNLRVAVDTLYIPNTVMLVLEWVLRSNFKFNKTQVTTTLSNLLASGLWLAFQAWLQAARTLFIQ